MDKNKKIASIVAAVAVVIVAIGIFIWWQRSPAQQQKARIAQAVKIMTTVLQDTENKQNNSKFSISGTIVDDAGQPVDQVTVYISQGYLKDAGINSQYVHSTQVVNHEFKIDLAGGSSVYMEFYKKGYYRVKNVQFALARSKEPSSVYSGNAVIAPTQKIVLERKGTLAKYSSINASFFISQEQFFTSYLISEMKRIGQEISFSKISTLPAGTIYPNVGHDKDGKIIKVLIDKVGNGRLGPRTVLLNMVGGNNDGFILIKDNSIGKITDMKEAPDAGYVKQMIFTLPEDLHNTYFFYYKFGSQYGKGWVSNFSCSSDGEIHISSMLYQNTETSSDLKVRRNLRTK